MTRFGRRFLPLVLIMIPPLMQLIYIQSFAVDVLFWDDWELVLLLKTPPSLSTMDYLWSQHNEHRILFPRLLLFGLARASDFNTIVPIYIGLLLAGLSAVGLWFVYKQTWSSSIWAFVPISWFIFNLGQWENILWGWQISVYLCVAASIWGLCLLVPDSIAFTVLAALLGLVASFSFSNGLLIWPIGFAYLITARAELKRVATWTAVGLAAVTFYLWHFTLEITQLPSPTTVLSEPARAIAFFLANIGAPLGMDRLEWSVVVGGVLLAFIVIAGANQLRQKGLAETKFLLAATLVLFGLLSSVAVTLGRSGLGMESALLSRYRTVGLLGITGIYLLLVRQLAPRERGSGPAGRWSLIFFVVLAAIGISQSTRHAIPQGRALRTLRIELQEILLTFDQQPDEALARLYPNPSLVRERAAFLKSRGFSVFRASERAE